MTDIVVVGGGIVGLSVARALIELNPDLSLKVLEKEPVWGAHQTGHNSGVLHSGIYYKPGSLKARLAKAGNAEMVRFCQEQGIAHEVCGKVIVAADESEIPALDRLMERAAANGVAARRLSGQELREREPHARGVAALHVPSTGIVDFGEVADALAREAAEKGVELHLQTRLESIERVSGETRLGTSTGSFATRFLINCAGLHSDRVADWDGAETQSRVLPIRGDYYQLRPERTHLVRHLIYPVPDPRFPFLGVHLTRSIHGDVHVGPNAVVSMAREGYGRAAFNFSDASEMMRSRNFWEYARRNWRHSLSEARTGFSLKAFARKVQRLVPDIRPEDLLPSASGIRAQSVSSEGELMEDFHVVVGRDSLHVCNAASPAATSAIELGRYIAQQARQAVGFPSAGPDWEGWPENLDQYQSGLCEI
ncbi:MAG: L-2-hydroxyglutarate oxidase [Verrucomicrobia bacterium]|nr:L-2-hydroxyglutarate oxidase [Verrucomicrobiota bacterium]MBI3869066.1 L-2-hydroxyglutarate oxidase [Verrucomicrobiota bacterium]